MSQSTEKLISSLSSKLPRKTNTWSINLQYCFWVITSLSMTYLNFKVFGLKIRPEILSNNPMIPYEVIFLGILILLSSFSAILLSRPDRGEQFRFIPLVTLLLWGILFTWALASGPGFQFSGSFTEYLMSACFRSVFYLGLLPTIVLFALVRWGATTKQAWASAMVALAGAGIGFLAMRVECPYQEPFHLIFSHMLPSVLLVAIGILIGKKILVW